MNIHLGRKRDFLVRLMQAPMAFIFRFHPESSHNATENAISGAMSSIASHVFSGIIFFAQILALEHQGGWVSRPCDGVVTQNFLFLRFITGRGASLITGSATAIHCEYF